MTELLGGSVGADVLGREGSDGESHNAGVAEQTQYYNNIENVKNTGNTIM
jgi:hypothetical protein